MSATHNFGNYKNIASAVASSVLAFLFLVASFLAVSDGLNLASASNTYQNTDLVMKARYVTNLGEQRAQDDDPEFILYDEDNNELARTFPDAKGDIAFLPVGISEEEIGNTLKFKIVLSSDFDDKKITQRRTSAVVKVKVEGKDADGSLIFNFLSSDPVFTGTYESGMLSVTKETPEPTSDKFQFKLVRKTPVVEEPEDPEESEYWAAIYGLSFPRFVGHHNFEYPDAEGVLLIGANGTPIPETYGDDSFVRLAVYEHIKNSDPAPWIDDVLLSTTEAGYGTTIQTAASERIARIVFLDEVHPISTRNWFKGMGTGGGGRCVTEVSVENAELLDTAGILDASGMFTDYFGKIPNGMLTQWTFQNLKYADDMFRNACFLDTKQDEEYGYTIWTNVDCIDLSKWNMRMLTSADRMFSGLQFARSYNGGSLDISTWECPRLKSADGMFAQSECNTIYCNYDWTKTTEIQGDGEQLMFEDCRYLFGGAGTEASPSCESFEFARPDTVDNLGVFTARQNAITETNRSMEIPFASEEDEKIIAGNAVAADLGDSTDTEPASSEGSSGNLSKGNPEDVPSASASFEADDDGEIVLQSDNGRITKSGSTIHIYGGTLESTADIIWNSDYTSCTVTILRKWDGTDISSVLSDSDIKKIVISDATISSAQDMFYNFSWIESIVFENCDSSQCIDMSGMFAYCSSLTELDIRCLDTSSVAAMGPTVQCLCNCKDEELEPLDAGMFQECSSLVSLDLSNFDTSSCNAFSRMFQGCSSLISLDLSSFTTERGHDWVCWAGPLYQYKMYAMFAGCISLKTLNIENFTTSNMSPEFFFYKDDNLEELIIGNGFVPGGADSEFFVNPFAWIEDATELKIYNKDLGRYLTRDEIDGQWGGYIRNSVKDYDLLYKHFPDTPIAFYNEDGSELLYSFDNCHSLNQDWYLMMFDDFDDIDYSSAAWCTEPNGGGQRFPTEYDSFIDGLASYNEYDPNGIRLYLRTFKVLDLESPELVDQEEIYFTLYSGETVTFSNFPPLSEYIVYELTSDGWKQTNSIGTSGIISPGELSEATVFNELEEPESTSVTISGAKFLDNEPASGFSFYITENSNIIDDVVSDSDGHFSFTIEYTEPGEHVYHISESKESRYDDQYDIEYDDKVYEVRVTITRDADNGLSASVEHDDILFENKTKKGLLSISKTVEGASDRNRHLKFSVSVHLKFPDGSEEDRNFHVSTDEGQSLLLPVGTEYKVSENNIPENYELRGITNESGTIESESGVEVIVVNRYIASGEICLSAQKQAQGFDLKGNDFEFTLMDSHEEVIERVRNDKDGTVSFAPISVGSDDIGSEKIFYIAESKRNYGSDNDAVSPIDDMEVEYDKRIYKVIASLEDNGDGSIETVLSYYILPGSREADAVQVDSVVFSNSAAIPTEMFLPMTGGIGLPRILCAIGYLALFVCFSALAIRFIRRDRTDE